jgi:hypothetical protein
MRLFDSSTAFPFHSLSLSSFSRRVIYIERRSPFNLSICIQIHGAALLLLLYKAAVLIQGAPLNDHQRHSLRRRAFLFKVRN